MTKQNSLSLVFVLLLIAALVGAVLLVNQRQETRRGAYFSTGARMYMLPLEEVSGKVGDAIPVQVWVETKQVNGSDEMAKVSTIQTEVCYTGEGLELATEPKESVELNEEAFEILGTPTLKDNCLSFETFAMNREPTEMKSGAFRVATIRFKGKSAGEGQISYKNEKTLVGGYNTASGDTAIQLDSITGITYKVTESGDVALKWKKGTCNTGTGKWSCTEAANGTFDTQEKCEEAPSCEVEEDDDDDTSVWPILKYRISYDSVPKGARCAVNWPVQLIVLGGGKTQVYSDLKPERVENGSDLSVYEGEVELKGFNVLDNVAAFFKGPKHLQMKYGMQKQADAYNKSGGELTLYRKGSDEHVLYDFTAYPMLAGDVPNEKTGEGQDGVVNAIDYSLIKEGAETHKTLDEEGGYLTLDLDGNCQLNSKDVDVVKKTLKEKQGQLY